MSSQAIFSDCKKSHYVEISTTLCQKSENAISVNYCLCSGLVFSIAVKIVIILNLNQQLSAHEYFLKIGNSIFGGDRGT